MIPFPNFLARAFRTPLTLLCLAAGSTYAAHWEQSASVNFHEMPWGRYTEIVIEYLPSAEDAIAASQDPSKLAELAAEARGRAENAQHSLENQAVVILIPGLEYGMTGQFTGVRIESGDGISVKKDGRIGARLAESRTEYTGTVTIREFTEDRLTGSYSAQLYNGNMTDREIRARERDFVGHVSADFDIDLSPPDSSAYADHSSGQSGYTPIPSGIDPFNLPGVPADLSPEDAELLRRIQEAGVPPDMQGALLQMARDLPPGQLEMVLKSYKSSY